MQVLAHALIDTRVRALQIEQGPDDIDIEFLGREFGARDDIVREVEHEAGKAGFVELRLAQFRQVIEGERAGIDLLANSGNLSVTGLADSKIGGYGLVGDSADYARVFPASLTATAAGGNIDLFGQSSVASAVLFPSATGQLRLWADGDILLGEIGRAHV